MSKRRPNIEIAKGGLGAEVILLICQFPEDPRTLDFEAYTDAVERILERYDRKVVNLVTSPITGISVRQKLRPTPAEVQAACEAQKADLKKASDLARLVDLFTKSDKLRYIL